MSACNGHGLAVLSDSLGVGKVSGSGPPPVRRRTVASCAGFGLLKITSGEGFYRRRAAGARERREIGCLCALPDCEGTLDRC